MAPVCEMHKVTLAHPSVRPRETAQNNQPIFSPDLEVSYTTAVCKNTGETYVNSATFLQKWNKSLSTCSVWISIFIFL